MGASPSVSGLYYAYGFSGSGFQLGPGVGHVMAELIGTGRTDVEMTAFRPVRFLEPGQKSGAPYNRDGD